MPDTTETTVIVTAARPKPEGFIPDVQVFARPSTGGDYADVTGKLKSRLASITFTDNAEMEADTIELNFDDGDDEDLTMGGGIEYPEMGAHLKVWIGYRETGLTYCGIFVVDEDAVDTSPFTIRVTAKSAQFAKPKNGSSKAWTSHRTRSFKNKTISELLAQIAGEHNVKASCDPTIGKTEITHINQTNESDSHFLTRIARNHSGAFTVKNDSAIITAAGSGNKTSGTTLPVIEYVPSKGEKITLTRTTRGADGTVRGKYRVKTSTKILYATAGNDEPVRTLKHIYATEEEAKKAAEAELNRLNRAAGGSIEISCTGSPDYLAGAKIRVSGSRSGINGDWYMKTVEHSIDFDSGGYTCRITGEKPK